MPYIQKNRTKIWLPNFIYNSNIIITYLYLKHIKFSQICQVILTVIIYPSPFGDIF